MQSLPLEERPYEKCEKFGAESLSDTQLLAVLLRTGTKGKSALNLAEEIIYPEHFGQGLLNIHHWAFQQLMKIKGMGRVKAIQVLCLAELSKRLSKANATKGLAFDNPSSIADYYKEDMRHAQQEHIKLLLLNSKSHLIGETNISKGTVNASIITPRELFIDALSKGAVSIILLHNHPSGDPSPSKEDVLITKRVLEAGKLIGIELVDHIIIGNNCYTSFCEMGIL